jgi:hypothetical protein
MPRARRAPISSTITYYRFRTPNGDRTTIGTRAIPQKVESRPVHDQPPPTQAMKDQAIVAGHGGQRPTHSTSWDQDN